MYIKKGYKLGVSLKILHAWKQRTQKHFFFVWRNSPQWATASSFMRFLDHTQWRTIVGRIPLDERSARRRYLYLTIHNIFNRQRSMPAGGFEPTISANKRPQNYTLYIAASETGTQTHWLFLNKQKYVHNVNDNHVCCLFSWRYNPFWLYFSQSGSGL